MTVVPENAGATAQSPSASSIPSLPLRSGTTIPQLGFGTYKLLDEDAYAGVRSALDLGYRHIDTAQMYTNEAHVGRAIADSGVEREHLFVTSKLNNPNHEPDVARESFEQSLKDLGTDYVDLFLIHWPVPMHYGGDFVTTWKVLEEFYASGRARAIGVSNFEKHHLTRLLEECDIVPMVNQIEVHPYFANNDLRAFNAEHGIVTEAWAPLARGTVLDDPTVAEVARKCGVSPSRAVLRWGFQRGDILFPKASHVSRQRENMEIFDFELSAEQMARLDALDRGEEGRTGLHPNVMDRM